MNISSSDLLLKHPFTAIISGPTGSGKTFLTRNILCDHESLMNMKNIRVIWCYGIWQDTYELPLSSGVMLEYSKGLVGEDHLKESKPDVVVVDDLMSELGDNKSMANMFTRLSHHMNISVIFIIQNIFHQGKVMRNISLNAQYIFLLKSRRDLVQVSFLAKQLFPERTKFFMEAYEDATKVPFGYLLIDLKPNTPEQLRLRTRITSIEKPKSLKSKIAPIIYVPK